jgi:hypothetical protein
MSVPKSASVADRCADGSAGPGAGWGSASWAFGAPPGGELSSEEDLVKEGGIQLLASDEDRPRKDPTGLVSSEVTEPASAAGASRGGEEGSGWADGSVEAGNGAASAGGAGSS